MHGTVSRQLKTKELPGFRAALFYAVTRARETLLSPENGLKIDRSAN